MYRFNAELKYQEILFIYLIGGYWQAASKIYTDIWRTYNSQGNLEEQAGGVNTKLAIQTV